MAAVIVRGDARHLPLADASVDAIVTDPPYELGFMARSWDSAGVAFDPATWAECLRVLKPGGYLLAFGGTRTWHRMVCAIEDAGFEIRDSIHWIYGSGFPKSLDVSKAIDRAAGAEREVVGMVAPSVGGGRSTANDGWRRPWMDDERARDKTREITAPATPDAARWQGWGTALKPAHEPIIVARKSLDGTVASNVLTHGTGALNIDACRTDPLTPQEVARSGRSTNGAVYGALKPTDWKREGKPHPGRWPTNVVFTHSASCVGGGPCAPDCPVAELDRQSVGKRASKPSKSGSAGTQRDAIYGGGKGMPRDYVPISRDDAGGASRFFPVFRYEAKAPASERPRGEDGTAHVTVKPLALMRWLVRLVTPPGGICLDPFLGSGTTAEACLIEGFRCVGVELDATHLPLIKARLSKPIQPTLEVS